MRICPNHNPLCDIKFQRATKDDHDSIVSFLEIAFPHMHDQIPFWNRYIASHGDNFLLKDSENRIKGYVSIENINNIGNVNFIAIDPQFQGDGMGSKLLSVAETKMETDEYRLHTEGNKMQNLIFYNKNGWTIYEVDPNGYEHTTAVEFRKKKKIQ